MAGVWQLLPCFGYVPWLFRKAMIWIDKLGLHSRLVSRSQRIASRDRQSAHPHASRSHDRGDKRPRLTTATSSRVSPLGTICGSNEPLRSRGTSRSSAPSSVSTVLG